MCWAKSRGQESAGLGANHNLYLPLNMCQPSIICHKSYYLHFTDEGTEAQQLGDMPSAT